jgi:hypothetical protein
VEEESERDEGSGRKWKRKQEDQIVVSVGAK